MRILVIAPHSDDEILGCGGTIVNHVMRGDVVYSCIVTKAYEPEWTKEQIEEREWEINKVVKILGITEVFRLGLPTVKLDTIPQKTLNDLLFDVIQSVQPDTLYIPHQGDINKDHQLVFESAMVAVRPITKVPARVLSYEVLSSTEWYNQTAFNPNVYVDISKTLEVKIKAMEQYKHGLKQPPHPRSIKGIISLATLRGFTIGVEAAEAFSLVREIIK
jgi:LmbE family N-acetylglucosaminyl deacetylase